MSRNQLSISLRIVLSLARSSLNRRTAGEITCLLLVLIASSALLSASPLALKYSIDSLSNASRERQPLLAIALVGVYALSQWIGRTLSETRGLLSAKVQQRLSHDLSEHAFMHIMLLPREFHVSRRTGSLIETLNNARAGYQMIFSSLVFTLLPVLTELITMVSILLHLGQPVLMAIFCGSLVFYYLGYSRSVSTFTVRYQSALSEQMAGNALVTDALINYETVKLFAAEDVVARRYKLALETIERAWLLAFRCGAQNGVIIATVFAVYLFGTLGYAMWQVAHDQMTVGALLVVSVYVARLIQPVETIGNAIKSLFQGLASFEALVRILKVPAEPVRRGSIKCPEAPVSLEFDSVTSSYDSKRRKRVLDGVTFHVPPKSTIGVVGMSGAGKSTLVRLLVRLIDPMRGVIRVGGVDISKIELSELRRAIAVVPQDTLLFNDTVKYNISLGRPGSAEDEIEAAARMAQVHEFICSLPDGYETLVGERGVKLSGGERQRISIARAILKRPKIYVFDEATSSLDTSTEREIMASIRKISMETTTLIIAHRLSTVVHADQIIVLADGRVAEHGSHADLLELGGLYSILWKSQRSGVGRESAEFGISTM